VALVDFDATLPAIRHVTRPFDGIRTDGFLAAGFRLASKAMWSQGGAPG
jgi:hypothetical protein